MDPDQRQDVEQPGGPLDDAEVDQVTGGALAPQEYSSPIIDGSGPPMDNC